MHWLDGAIIALIIWLSYSAFQAGFIRETVTIVAAVLGIIMAGLFYQDLADDVFVWIDNETLASIVGFVVIFGSHYGQTIDFFAAHFDKNTHVLTFVTNGHD